MGAIDERERLIADSQFGGGATTWAPATWHLGLSVAMPNDDGTGFVEPVGFAYGRSAQTNNAINFPAAQTITGVTTKRNGTKFTFANPTGTWGMLVAYGWFTAPTGLLPQYFNPLDTPITVQNGNTPVEFDIGQLVMPWD